MTIEKAFQGLGDLSEARLREASVLLSGVVAMRAAAERLGLALELEVLEDEGRLSLIATPAPGSGEPTDG